MKIVHVITSLNRGGAEVALKKLIEKTYIEHDVSVICLFGAGVVADEIKALGINVIDLGLTSLSRIYGSVFWLRSYFKQSKPDIVQTWLYHSDFIGGCAAKLAGINNIIWSVRTTRLKQGAYLTIVLRFILSFLSHFIPQKIVCVAEASRVFHEKLGYSRKKMLVIGNGFDSDNLDIIEPEKAHILKELGVAPNEILVGSIARYSQDKAQDLFIDAAASLLKQHNNLKFLLVGFGNDHHNSELVSLINNSGFSSKFILLGERSDLSVLYTAIDIFCLHSRTEGFPNVLGEAMMFGKPCVVTRAGDAEFVLGNTGIVADFITGNHIALALNSMLKLTPNQRLELGDKAKVRIAENFSLQSVVSKYLILYKSLVVGS